MAVVSTDGVRAIAVALLVGLAIGLPLVVARPVEVVVAESLGCEVSGCSIPSGQTAQIELSTPSLGATWGLASAAPVGLTVDARTGVVTWTPTSNQVGSVAVTIAAAASGVVESTHVVEIDVTLGAVESPDALWVVPAGHPDAPDVGDMDGTLDHPFSYEKLRSRLCGTRTPAPGVLYFRGGTYDESPPAIDQGCSGTGLDTPLELRPWGGERALIHNGDAFGFKLTGDYLTLEGFDIRGRLSDISQQDVLDHWWEEGSPLTDGGVNIVGQGILVSGKGQTIRDNVVWDWPGNGVKSDDGACLATIVDNVIFNAGWWSTRGVGGLMVSDLVDCGVALPAGRSEGVVVAGNLVFAAESRMISHVFSKEFTTMEIDEGSAANIQQNNGDNTDGYLLQDNFFLFSGKGVGLRAPGIRFVHNTLHQNGSNLRIPGSAGIRATVTGGNDGAGATIDVRNNAVTVPLGHEAYSFSPAAAFLPDGACVGNVTKGVVDDAIGVGPSTCRSGNAGNVSVASEVFVDAASFDFETVVGDAGADQEVFDRLAERLASRGLVVGPSGFDISSPDDYRAYVQPLWDSIVSTVPVGADGQAPTLTFFDDGGTPMASPVLGDGDHDDWHGVGAAEIAWTPGQAPAYHSGDPTRVYANPYRLEFANEPSARNVLDAAAEPAEGGHVTCDANSVRVDTGDQSVHCSAVAAPGWEFTGWENGACSGSSPACHLDLDTDLFVVAGFAPTVPPTTVPPTTVPPTTTTSPPVATPTQGTDEPTKEAPTAPRPADDQVARLYRAVFDRSPDVEGLAFWAGRYRSGVPLEEIAESFLVSPEAEAVFDGGVEDGALVDALYRGALGREPDLAGRAFWLGRLATGWSRSSVVVAFSDSDESIARTNTSEPLGPPESQVARLYRAVFDRSPDVEGLAFWAGRYRSGVPLEEIAESFLVSPEALALFDGGVEDGALVDALYQGALGRDPDRAGRAFWSGRLDAGWPRSSVVVAFSESEQCLDRTGTSR